MNDLSQIYLSHHKPISNLFLTLGITTFREALKYVHELPYGRNLDRTDYLSVLNEKRGTCSTKHALIYKLGCECEIDITLHMAVFMMNRVNTPKISAILNEYNLSHIPEMHCYLRYKNRIIDITFPENSVSLELIEEEKIEPEHLGNYKVKKHKQFIENWLPNYTIQYNMEQIFKIRELCIKQLER
ncbi:hypothetical protein [Wolbachia endosymbiont of Oedothorax gibbosus]|uniref:hypothetical protein n=1 Tax=Wolbachia endosymbiont of Oedothorax gibbosus TaxID=931100 RepID=UPI0020255607|nr:hypothetical protein [Wolbachia endosymbiont of Oedothorax gibbosus]